MKRPDPAPVAPAFRWVLGVRRWLHGDTGPGGEQLAFPNMPEPPERLVTRAVGFVVYTYASPDGGSVRPGHRALARVLGVDERSVRRAIGELRRAGLLITVGGHTAPGRARGYRLALPAWLDDTGHPGPVNTGHPGPVNSAETAKHRTRETETPDPPVRLPSHDLAIGGDARATTSAAPGPADQPPPPCERHKNGNPRDEPCRACQAVREHGERQRARVKESTVTSLPPPMCPECFMPHDAGPCPEPCEHGTPDPSRCVFCRRERQAG